MTEICQNCERLKKKINELQEEIKLLHEERKTCSSRCAVSVHRDQLMAIITDFRKQVENTGWEIPKDKWSTPHGR